MSIKKSREKNKRKKKIRKKKIKSRKVMRFIIYVCLLLEVRTHVYAKTPLEPN